jgi:hypothetical protein
MEKKDPREWLMWQTQLFDEKSSDAWQVRVRYAHKLMNSQVLVLLYKGLSTARISLLALIIWITLACTAEAMQRDAVRAVLKARASNGYLITIYGSSSSAVLSASHGHSASSYISKTSEVSGEHSQVSIMQYA